MSEGEQSREYRRAVLLHGRAVRYHALGESARPERLYLQALKIQEEILGPEHPEVAAILGNLAQFYKAVGRLAEARRLYERALPALRRSYGASHEAVATMLFNQAQLLRAEAEAMEARAARAGQEAREAADPKVLAKAVIRQDRARFRLSMRTSRIHRLGVFAEEAIAAGQAVIEYTGERVSRREAARRRAGGGALRCRLNSYWSLDGSAGGSGAEMINHGCEPNCGFESRDGGVWVVSRREIAAGDELLLDYQLKRSSQIVPCYCGAAACRGALNL